MNTKRKTKFQSDKNIDESWKRIGNLKSGMRELEDKLNKYSENIKLLSSFSQQSFLNTSNQQNNNLIFNSNSFQSTVTKPPPGPRKAKLEQSFLEASTSTIQAGDPSFILHKSNPALSDSYAEIKYLNDLTYSLINKPSNIDESSSKFTKVDVYIPSDKSSKSNFKTGSMISKDKLTRKTTSSDKRSSSEDNKYPDFIQATSTRVLHRDSDLLPTEYSSSSKFLNYQSNITKRHLATGSSSTLIETQNNKYFDLNNIKPSSRKTAFSTSNSNNDLLNPEDFKYKYDIKEETDRLLGLTSSKKLKKTSQIETDLTSNSKNAIITTSSWRIGEQIAQKQLKQHLNESDKLKKQLQDHDVLMQQHSNNMFSYQHRSTSAPINNNQASTNTQSPQQQNVKKTKRTDCHLIQTVTQKSSPKPTSLMSMNMSSPQLNAKTSKQKPYDLNDIHKYIQSQKSKRLHETKTEKEKQKLQDEERKKKLQELYRKQRLHALKSAQMTNNHTTYQTSSKTQLNSSGSNNNSANNSNHENRSSSNHKSYEQDMSKILMDRISHLLNDNDKLVEKKLKLNQQQQMQAKKSLKKVGFEENNKENSADMDDSQLENNDNDYDSVSSGSNNPNSSISFNLTPTKNKVTSNKSNNSNSHNVKHDRLKKICSMALDLQTKLQQTKLKLFGLNPNDEDDIADYFEPNTKQLKPESDTFITSTKHEIEESNFEPDQDMDQDSDAHEDDEDEEYFLKEKQRLIQFEKVFKQDIRDENNKRKSSIKNYKEFDLDESRPGIGNIATFKPTPMNRDLAARKIQHAFRLYISKKRISTNTNKNYLKPKSSIKPIKHEIKINENKINLLNQKDDYNFINVYKRKSSSNNTRQESISSKQQPITKPEADHNYTDDFMTYQDQTIQPFQQPQQPQQLQQLSTKSSISASSSTSSSDSTSLSKYITNSKQSLTKNQHQSAKTQSRQDESSVSSSQESTTTISSSANQTLSKQTQPTASRPKSILIEQVKKTRIIQDLNENEPKRYSPSSLERLLNVGINYLDTLNMGALQLEELDKVRCIGYAQQETVALAHLLKENNNKQANNNAQQALKTSSDSNSKSKSVSSSLSSSSSSSASSSSYSTLNEETENKQQRSRTQNQNKPKQDRNKRNSLNINEQDLSIINTVTDLNNTDISKNKNLYEDEIDDVELEKSFRQVLPVEQHLKKNKQEHKEHSLIYDLSQSSFSSQLDTQPTARLSFEDDSFKKFTGEIVKKYMQEEELRSKHQAHLLKLREKALIEKTKSELSWLEQMKKKAQDKGEDEKMPLILRKEKGIMQKLKQEQDNINKMKEVQRKATENRLKILSQHSEVVKWCQNKLKEQGLKSIVKKQSDATNKNEQSSLIDESINTTTAIKSNENDVDEVSTATLASTTGSITSSTSSSSTPTPTQNLNEQDDQLDESSINNQSLIESKIMKQVKQHLSSEKYLTEREKKLRLRRKHAEEIIAWKKKLDDEELQVREIEKRANQVLNEKQKLVKQPSTTKLIQQQQQQKVKNNNSKHVEEEEENVKIGKEKETTSSNSDDVIKTEPRQLNQNNSYAESSFISISTNIANTKQNKSQTLLSVPTQINDESSIKTSIEQKIEDDTHKDNTSSSSSSSSSTTSISDPISSSSSSNTSTSVKELELKVKELKNEYIKKRNEAEKLGKMLKEAEKMKMKEKEEQLRKKIESYDTKLEKIKHVLNNSNNKEEEKKPKIQIKKALVKEESLSSFSSSSLSSTTSSKNLKTNQVEQSIKTEIDISVKKDEQESNESQEEEEEEVVEEQELKQQEKEEQESKSTSSSRPTLNKQVDSIKYDDDFESEATKLKTSSSSSLSESSISSKDLKPLPGLKSQNEFKPKLEDNEELHDETKSTISEISEDILGNNSNVNNIERLGLEDEDQDRSTISNSSTDTQILLLGSSRVQKKFEKEKQEKFIESLEKSLLNEIIEQMIEIRDKKSSKLLADEYKESIKFELDEEYEDEQEEEEEEEQVEEINDMNKEVDINFNTNTNDIKIHIPSIDLSDVDEDGLSKTAKANQKNDKAPVFNIPFSREKITYLCDMVIEKYYWNKLDNLNSILESNYLNDEELIKSDELKEFFEPSVKQEKDVDAKIEINFKKMLFDLVGELCYDLYLEKYEKPQLISEFLPGHKKLAKKKHFKSYFNGPKDLIKCKELIIEKVCSMLKLTNNKHDLINAPNVAKSKWRVQKKLDLVDGLLDLEMREQEHEWSNYEIEEYEAKLHITNSIFDMLLKDTIECFQINLIKKQSFLSKKQKL